MVPNRFDINAALVAAAAAASLAEFGLGEANLEDAALELTTHLRMCFSNVEATEKGMAQNLHL